MLVFAGVAFGLLLVCQINAPSLMHRQVPVPCQEQAGLAACVVMGPKKVKLENTRNQGFTLIELSIVLVIIGLVVGGVLVGQDLINAANVRSQISQIDKYNAAVHTFQLKFNCLPGDCNNAVALGLGTTGGAGDNGNGDGSIGSPCLKLPFFWTQNNGSESLNFWYHLAQAGLTEGGLTGYISGTTTSLLYGTAPSTVFPVAKINSSAFIVPSAFNCGTTIDSRLRTGGNGFVIGAFSPGANTGQVHFSQGVNPGAAGENNPALTYLQAYQIDIKIDDGKPLTGNVGILEYWNTSYAEIANTTAALEPCATSGNDYNTSSANISFNGYTGPAMCNLAFINQ